MSDQDRSSFSADFMDDYFAEADEHIVAVRRSLLLLEPVPGATTRPPATVLEELLRSFHSLKGISAMVELREAELLAHHLEGALREIAAGALTVTPAVFDALVEGARTLESVVLASRESHPIPSIDRSARAIARLTADAPPHPDASHTGASSQQTRDTAAVSDSPLWTVSFVPSRALLDRGVKVDTIRARLLDIGHIVRVAPKVLAGGGISFEFIVRTDREDGLAALSNDGVAYEAIRDDLQSFEGEPEIQERAAPSHESTLLSSANSVRVDLHRLDELMRLVGDLVVTRSRLTDSLQRIERHVPPSQWRAIQEHTTGIERQLRDLRESVMRVRLVPIADVFRRMPFVVRDLARDSGRQIHLELVGQETEIDKLLIERIMDPMLHLVRNAISHGIETPEERVAAGKPPEGTIRLKASTIGETVVLEIADDGRGIDAAAVAARARKTGMPLSEGPVDAAGLLDILCASGFSTRDEADRAAGRGVGMAVVRDAVSALGGAVALETSPGRGTTFSLTLPLTLAITDAILTHVGDQMFAVPQSAVEEVIEIDASHLRAIERNELITYRKGTLPVVRLAKLFGISVADRPRLHAIVVGTGINALGIVVDRIAGQREIVVKTIVDPLIRMPGVSGATELGDGRLVLILDMSAMSQTLREWHKPGEVIA